MENRTQLKKYQIEIFNLNYNKYDYQFDIDDSFFELMEQVLIQKGNLKVSLQLTKSENMIKANFKIAGNVELLCDRSLENFMYPLHADNMLYYKFADHDEELTDEIILIKHGTSVINVAQPIFDFIALQIPIKKIHPRFQDEDNEGDILIYKTGSADDEDEEGTKGDPDPRWEALKKLKGE